MKKTFIALLACSLLMASCGGEEAKTEENATNETAPAADTTAAPVEEETAVALPEGWEFAENPEIMYLSITDSVTEEQMQTELGMKYGMMFGEIMGHLGGPDKLGGAPFSHWVNWNPEGYSTFEACIPVTEEVAGTDRVVFNTIPAGKALKYNHLGGYDQVSEPYMSITEYFENGGSVQTGGPWEVYVTDPSMEPDTSKWLTEIWFPIAE